MAWIRTMHTQFQVLHAWCPRLEVERGPAGPDAPRVGLGRCIRRSDGDVHGHGEGFDHGLDPATTGALSGHVAAQKPPTSALALSLLPPGVDDRVIPTTPRAG